MYIVSRDGTARGRADRTLDYRVVNIKKFLQYVRAVAHLLSQ